MRCFKSQTMNYVEKEKNPAVSLSVIIQGSVWILSALHCYGYQHNGNITSLIQFFEAVFDCSVHLMLTFSKTNGKYFSEKKSVFTFL